jgi:Methylase involved in ubiquinone/menaquinone biosynthesis
MGNRLRRNREKLDVELRASWKRAYFSPATLSLSNTLIPQLRAAASGKLLDVGSGTMPFRSSVIDLVDEYRSLDIERRVPEVDIVADVRDMDSVNSDTFDVLLCSQVLEHISEPDKAIKEMARVLRPGGRLVLTVPFLGRLHEEPFDYFRFTKYGLESLLDAAGLQVKQILPTGSLLCFLGHQVSTLLVCSVWDVPILKDMSFWANMILVVLPCYWLDRLLGMHKKMPLNYVAVAVKPPG